MESFYKETYKKSTAMNNFIFYSPTEFVFGRDTEKQTGVLLQKYGARKGNSLA